MDKSLPQMDLGNLVMTEAPYNILTNLQVNPLGNLSAWVRNEYHYREEGGPIGAAEFGRHIAVLGSMQLARDFNFGKPYFFMVTYASINRCSEKTYEEDCFHLKTQTLQAEKRKGRVYGQIEDSAKNVVFDSTLEYAILKPDLFFKVYTHYYTNTFIQNTVSPYVNRRELSDIKVENYKADAYYGEVLPYECEGHFENYPALPIAILGNLLSQLGIHLFKQYSSRVFNQVIIKKAKIQAYKLAFHQDEITLHAEILEVYSNSNMRISSKARVNDEDLLVAEIELKGM